MVGISCRSDVTEMLEKRVKSRFSYRRQLVLNPIIADFDSPEEGPCALLGALLTLPDAAEADTEESCFVRSFNGSIQSSLGSAEVKARLRRLCDVGVSKG